MIQTRKVYILFSWILLLIQSSFSEDLTDVPLTEDILKDSNLCLSNNIFRDKLVVGLSVCIESNTVDYTTENTIQLQNVEPPEENCLVVVSDEAKKKKKKKFPDFIQIGSCASKNAKFIISEGKGYIKSTFRNPFTCIYRQKSGKGKKAGIALVEKDCPLELTGPVTTKDPLNDIDLTGLINNIFTPTVPTCKPDICETIFSWRTTPTIQEPLGGCYDAILQDGTEALGEGWYWASNLAGEFAGTPAVLNFQNTDIIEIDEGFGLTKLIDKFSEYDSVLPYVTLKFVDQVTHYNGNLVKLPSTLLDGFRAKIINIMAPIIESLPPGLFSNIQTDNLDSIVLDMQKLKEIPEEFFDGLTALKYMMLYLNNDEIPARWFDQKELIHFSFLSPSVTHIDPGILPNAKTIELGPCNFVEPLSDQVFNGLDKLQTLAITQSNHPNFHDNTFKDLQELESLVLYYNKITQIQFGLLNLPKLNNLDLRFNSISSVATGAFIYCPNLRTVNLQSNQLAYFDPSSEIVPGTTIMFVFSENPCGYYMKNDDEFVPCTAEESALTNSSSFPCICYTAL